jgi:hypothetical protein
MMQKLFLTLIVIILLLIYACSAATGKRYEETKPPEETKETEITEAGLDEDFDITPYKTKIEIDEESYSTGSSIKDVWFGYDETTLSNSDKQIVGTADGFRVQIISTDDLERANDTKLEVYFKLGKDVYVNFEPPFYKVKVGDFATRSEANDLKFKLNQLGYSEAKVVQETINLFE